MSDITSFYENVNKLQKKIQEADNTMKDSLLKFDKGVTGFSKNITKIKKDLSKRVDSPDVRKFFSQLLDQVSTSFGSWNEEKTNYIDGQKFRNEFNDSLIIIIYGKVKAGKSTLGNLVAELSPRGIKPSFFRYDQAGQQIGTKKLEEIDEDSFDVKSTECTSSIQGFRIPGVTWVDTPGLLSMTKKNGNLAKQYVDNADLIIYPMSSDSPGRKTDATEIYELVKKGKEYSVVITKSDRMEEDEFNGRVVSIVVNKSTEDRKKQEEWTIASLDEVISKNSGKGHTFSNSLSEIFSISTLVAKESQVGSPEWKNSNIEKFYSTMNNIINKDAIRLKVEQPQQKQKATLRKLVEGNGEASLKSILSKVNKKIKDITEKELNLTREGQNLINSSIPVIKTKVELELRSSYDSKEAPNEFIPKIQKIIQNEVSDSVATMTSSAFSDLIEDFQATFPSYKMSSDGLSFEAKYDKIKYTNTIHTKGAGAAVGGAAATIGAGVAIANFWNPAGWAILGAMAVAAAAGAAGGVVGGKAGELCSTTHTKEVQVGDNYEDVRENIMQHTETAVKESIELAIKNIKLSIFNPLAEALEKVSNEVDQLIKELEKEL